MNVLDGIFTGDEDNTDATLDTENPFEADDGLYGFRGVNVYCDSDVDVEETASITIDQHDGQVGIETAIKDSTSIDYISVLAELSPRTARQLGVALVQKANEIEESDSA
jgi:hypothetical protein